ncbi:hypothetical protein BJY52DRAFT_1193042 [Lactarius psammicola]|nr:hypothetical protein BJY52DRAFT_1193042 [Lactarius psammicola]
MARRTRNSQRLMRNQTPGALGETYASLDLSSHADTMNTTSSVAGQGVNVQRSNNPTPPQTNLIGNRKRTTSSRNNGPEDIPTNAATGQPVPVKRPRNVGPARSHPLQLELAGESEIRQSQSDGVACMSRGGQQTVRPASSHAIVLNPEPTSLPNDDESHGESEEWSSEEDMADLTPGQPGRFNEAIANEGLATTTGPTTSVRRTSSAQGLTSHDDVSPWSNAVSVSRTSSTQTLTSCDDTSYGSNSTEPVLESEVPALAPAPLGSHLGNVSAESTSAWPVDTELQFAPGATRVMLTIQRPLMRSVIQDAIEILRASLMFDNAFLDSIHTLAFVRRSLLTSARKRCPTALSIHTRLVQDEDYISKIIPVLRARISLFRSEVKELCTSLVSPIFLSMTPGPKVALFAQRQLSNYNYTFPGQGGDRFAQTEVFLAYLPIHQHKLTHQKKQPNQKNHPNNKLKYQICRKHKYNQSKPQPVPPLHLRPSEAAVEEEPLHLHQEEVEEEEEEEEEEAHQVEHQHLEQLQQAQPQQEEEYPMGNSEETLLQNSMGIADKARLSFSTSPFIEA